MDEINKCENAIKELTKALERLAQITESTKVETQKLCEALISAYEKFEIPD